MVSWCWVTHMVLNSETRPRFEPTTSQSWVQCLTTRLLGRPLLCIHSHNIYIARGWGWLVGGKESRSATDMKTEGTLRAKTFITIKHAMLKTEPAWSLLGGHCFTSSFPVFGLANYCCKSHHNLKRKKKLSTFWPLSFILPTEMFGLVIDQDLGKGTLKKTKDRKREVT